jgi:hypothetical protein
VPSLTVLFDKNCDLSCSVLLVPVPLSLPIVV